MNQLESIQSPVFKFQLTALVFALPKGFLLWGYLFLLGDYLTLVAQHFGLGVGVGLAALSLLIILVISGTTSTKLQSLWGHCADDCTDIFRRPVHALPIV
jgi:hypothetical protein